NRVSIKPLAMNEQPEFASDGDMQKSLEYDQWLREHGEVVIHPPFYQVAEGKGDPWVMPGTEVAAVAAPAAPAAGVNPAMRQPPRMPYGGYGGYGTPPGHGRRRAGGRGGDGGCRGGHAGAGSGDGGLGGGG